MKNKVRIKNEKKLKDYLIKLNANTKQIGRAHV